MADRVTDYDHETFVLIDPPSIDTPAEADAWLAELADMRRGAAGDLSALRAIREAEVEAHEKRGWAVRKMDLNEAVRRGDRAAYVEAAMRMDVFSRDEAERLADEEGIPSPAAAPG